jgi:AcrR family transcriptional regulator
LLDAAVLRFAAEGIAATSTAKIAKDIGVTAAMVHYYFKSRDSLLDAVAEERLLRNVIAVWAPITENNLSAIEMVRGLVQRIMETGQNQSWLPTLWLREVASEGGQLRQRLLGRLPMIPVQTLLSRLTDGQRRGEMNQHIEPRLVMLSIIGLTLLPMATMSFWRNLPPLKGVSEETLARHAEALLLNGLFAPNLKPRRRA